MSGGFVLKILKLFVRNTPTGRQIWVFVFVNKVTGAIHTISAIHVLLATTRPRQMLVVRKGVVHVPGNQWERSRLTSGARSRCFRSLLDLVSERCGPLREDASRLLLYVAHLEACLAAKSRMQYVVYTDLVMAARHRIATLGPALFGTVPVSYVGVMTAAAEGAEEGKVSAGRQRATQLLREAPLAAVAAKEAAANVHTATVVMCPKCKSTRDIETTSHVTRSGDEGMTAFCTCPCGHKWKLAS